MAFYLFYIPLYSQVINSSSKLHSQQYFISSCSLVPCLFWGVYFLSLFKIRHVHLVCTMYTVGILLCLQRLIFLSSEQGRFIVN